MRHIRVTQPALDFWFDLRFAGLDARRLAVADSYESLEAPSRPPIRGMDVAPKR